MDINTMLQTLKKEPGFADNVGMVLVHNGVVRGWSRDSRKKVVAVEVTPNHDAVAAVARRMEQQPGIFRIMCHACSGTLYPGDDLLLLVVAGDIRENVQRTMAELLDTVKKEAVAKREIFAE